MCRHQTAAAAHHGHPCSTRPPDGDRGPVIGFVLERTDPREAILYVSGDTVWYDGIAEVGRRYKPAVALLFTGAARLREVGPAHLTLTAAEAVSAARALGEALIVPLHFEGWAHFSESAPEITRAFTAGRLADRLRWLVPGQALDTHATAG
jgi:L-ascorbate metabolism protein UlaG (beta-lactamase superfamily)